jgi:hypothetical protein
LPYDNNSHLWPNNIDVFFRDIELTPQLQNGPHCVSTSLAILTNSTPEEFQGIVNTQDPLSWSDKIQEWGMKFAYCPTDTRKLQYYITELVEIDDLFTLSYYTTDEKEKILADPNDNGWITGSHIVVMHRNMIYDSAKGIEMNAIDHPCNDCYTKRIFRVVPAYYKRGL